MDPLVPAIVAIVAAALLIWRWRRMPRRGESTVRDEESGPEEFWDTLSEGKDPTDGP